MRIVHHLGVRELLGRTAALAWRQPEEHKLPLDILEGLAELGRTARALGGPAAQVEARLVEVEQRGEPVGLALQTPPRNLVLGPMPARAAACLAGELRARGVELPGVLGPGPAARAFAGAFRESPALERMSLRLYRCDAVEPPARSVPGGLREVAPGEAELMVAWQTDFIRETGASDDPAHAREMVAAHLAAGRLFVWADETGAPRACIAHGGRALSLARIYAVYTPPAWRGRGLAAAMSAALTRRLLEEGAAGTVLFADQANPASNAVYRRVGYRPVGEWLELALPLCQ
jgi:predicted GNAT family acetyltransferase